MKRLPVMAVGLLAIVLGPTAPAGATDSLEPALVTCWSCHGPEGLPHDPTVPIIWGQQARYIEKQLRDFRAGDRDDQIMSSMAEAVPFKDLARAAEFIAAKPWPARTAAPAGAPIGSFASASSACARPRNDIARLTSRPSESLK